MHVRRGEDTVLTPRLHDELGVPEADAERFLEAVRGALDETTGAEDLYGRVARHTRLPPGKARELTQVACRLIGEELGPVELAHLESFMPGDVIELLTPPASSTPPTPPRHPVDQGETLASGRPGSRHPLSEAVPGHQDSIAHGGRHPHRH